MRIRFIAAVLLLSLLSFLSAKALKPDKGGKRIAIEVDSKKYDYWFVKKGKEIKYEISGIATVTFYIRKGLDTNPTVEIKVDNEILKTIPISANKSEKAATESFDKLTKAQKIKLKIAKGKHTITITTNDEIFIRASYTKKQKQYTFAPQYHSGGMALVVDENEYGYYKSIKEHPVQCLLNGGGTITVYSRLLYSTGTMGTQHYTVLVSIDDGKVTAYEFETKASDVAYFRSHEDIIPSKAGQIKIEVPEGKHTVTIAPGDSKEIAVRVMIPESMVKKTE